MKIKLLISLLFVIAFGCSKNPVGTGNDASEFFPLSIGNKWVYRFSTSASDSVIYEIFSSKSVNGKTYFSFGTSEASARWIREKGEKVFTLLDNEEYVWFDFSKQSKETYAYAPKDLLGSNYIVEVTWPVVADYNVGGHNVYNACVDFFFDIPGAVDDEHGFILAPHVGIVQQYGAWVNLYLVSYELN